MGGTKSQRIIIKDSLCLGGLVVKKAFPGRIICTFLFLSIFLTVLASCQAEASTVSLVFLGDIMPGRMVTLTEASLDYLEAALQSADLALANLEAPLTTASPATTQGYSLCASLENARILAKSGLDLLSIVNNHSLDCGTQGLQDTLSTLQSNSLIAITSQGYMTTIHNIKLTFFAFEDITSRLDLETATQLIQAARSNGSVVIVSMHWGAEYQGGASERQRELAEKLSAAGATLIWGHHPHVLQPVEWIPSDCADSQNKTGCSLILYSLGNALFDQAGLSDTRRSALVSVVLDQNGVLSIQATPFIIDPIHSLVKTPDKAASDLILSRLHLP
jgi:poly-gamma-glutamate synthesis protein (capsule biosynthesis protein)